MRGLGLGGDRDIGAVAGGQLWKLLRVIEAEGDYAPGVAPDADRAGDKKQTLRKRLETRADTIGHSIRALLHLLPLKAARKLAGFH